MAAATPDAEKISVAIIGAGISGVASAVTLMQRLEKEGLSHRVELRIYEKGDGCGGTWLWNTYPGAACDVMSHWYSFSFALNPHWPRRYSPQASIRSYIEDVAARFGVTPLISNHTTFLGARWVEAKGGYVVTLRDSRSGEERGAFAHHIIAGPGALSEPQLPSIPGRDSFAGRTWHTARWDHSFDLTGKRVAVIGTGCSAAQVVPAIAGKVASLTVYQRTAPWVTPRMDYSYSGLVKALFAWVPGLMWLYRMTLATLMDIRYHAFVRPNRWLTPIAMRIARGHLAAQVPDPLLRQALTPTIPLGCKRIIISDEWYPTLQAPHVSLVTGSITRIDATGVSSREDAAQLAVSHRSKAAGAPPAVDASTGAAEVHREFDAIVYATGFDVTASMEAIGVVGRSGESLSEAWAKGGGPECYYGITTPSFPNLYFLMGPNTGLGHSSMIAMIECQARYAAEAICTAATRSWAAVEVKPEVCAAYNVQLQAGLQGTTWTGCLSWYTLQGKKNVVLWPWTVYRYFRETAAIDWSAYRVTPRA